METEDTCWPDSGKSRICRPHPAGELGKVMPVPQCLQHEFILAVNSVLQFRQKGHISFWFFPHSVVAYDTCLDSCQNLLWKCVLFLSEALKRLCSCSSIGGNPPLYQCSPLEVSQILLNAISGLCFRLTETSLAL